MSRPVIDAIRAAAARFGLLDLGRACVLSLPLGVTLPSAAAGTPEDVRVERARIAGERATAEAMFDDRVQQCQERFVVTACVNAARAQRRETLERLAREQLVIDDAERRRRAAERLQAIEDKQQQTAGRDQDAAQRAAERAAQPASAAPADTRPAAPRVPRPSRTPAEVQAEAEQAAERAAARERRQQEAERRRAEVERRNAEREAQHQRAQPLPVPPAASAASAGAR